MARTRIYIPTPDKLPFEISDRMPEKYREKIKSQLDDEEDNQSFQFIRIGMDDDYSPSCDNDQLYMEEDYE